VFHIQAERRARYERERVEKIQDWMDVVDISKMAPATAADKALASAVR